MGLTVRLVEMFMELDVSGDGILWKEEFTAIMENEAIIAWLDQMQVGSKDAEQLFEALADGDGEVTLSEFVTGVNRLKGEATAVDAMSLMASISRVGRDVAFVKICSRLLDTGAAERK